MSRIEVIFGGILILAVIAAGSFVLFKNGMVLPVSVTSGSDRGALAASAEGERAIFTGVRETDLCTCYETAFTKGYDKLDLESVAYRSGYSACRGQLGVDGGEAWSAGWLNGQEGRLSKRTCRLYLKQVAFQ